MPRSRRVHAQRANDAGTSLAELLVTMGIMSVVMMLFTGGILQVYRTVAATDTRSDAQNELSRAFQRFDRELRYASWVNLESPGATGPWYVEFAGADPTDCFQLRLVPGSGANQGVLQLLTWTAGSPPAPGTKGQTIASQIDTTAGNPFSMRPYGATPYASPSPTPTGGPVGTDFQAKFQTLRVKLTARTGAGVARIDTTFTALNTTDKTASTNPCSEGRP